MLHRLGECLSEFLWSEKCKNAARGSTQLDRILCPQQIQLQLSGLGSGNNGHNKKQENAERGENNWKQIGKEPKASLIEKRKAC